MTEVKYERPIQEQLKVKWNPEDKLPFPRWDDSYTEDEYRAMLRGWFDSGDRNQDETEGFRRGVWEYICELQGVSPDD